MRSTIAINGPYFNTQRMLQQYVSKAYFPQLRPASTPVLEHVLAF
jgi:starch phosphorylase